MHELCGRINEVLGKARVDAAYRVTRLKLEEQRLNDAAEVRARLAERLGWQGWVCFQSRVVRLPVESLPEDAGRVLSAELALGEESLHLLPDGAGGWTLIRLCEGEGEEVLADEVRHLARDASDRLHYRRFWKRTEGGGFAPFAARLIGFTEV